MTSSRRYGAGAAMSVIDSGAYFNGSYRSPGDLTVEGELEGEIRCDGTLTIAQSARVSGTITAGHVSVSGQLRGEVDCSGRFEILASGEVSAGVLAGTVVIRDGAFYEGDMRMHVEPAGLPARELTHASGEPQRAELTPVPSAADDGNRAAPALHAVSE